MRRILNKSSYRMCIVVGQYVNFWSSREFCWLFYGSHSNSNGRSALFTMASAVVILITALNVKLFRHFLHILCSSLCRTIIVNTQFRCKVFPSSLHFISILKRHPVEKRKEKLYKFAPKNTRITQNMALIRYQYGDEIARKTARNSSHTFMQKRFWFFHSIEEFSS